MHITWSPRARLMTIVAVTVACLCTACVSAPSWPPASAVTTTCVFDPDDWQAEIGLSDHAGGVILKNHQFVPAFHDPPAFTRPDYEVWYADYYLPMERCVNSDWPWDYWLAYTDMEQQSIEPEAQGRYWPAAHPPATPFNVVGDLYDGRHYTRSDGAGGSPPSYVVNDLGIPPIAARAYFDDIPEATRIRGVIRDIRKAAPANSLWPGEYVVKGKMYPRCIIDAWCQPRIKEFGSVTGKHWHESEYAWEQVDLIEQGKEADRLWAIQCGVMEWELGFVPILGDVIDTVQFMMDTWPLVFPRREAVNVHATVTRVGWWRMTAHLRTTCTLPSREQWDVQISDSDPPTVYWHMPPIIEPFETNFVVEYKHYEVKMPEDPQYAGSGPEMTPVFNCYMVSKWQFSDPGSGPDDPPIPHAGERLYNHRNKYCWQGKPECWKQISWMLADPGAWPARYFALQQYYAHHAHDGDGSGTWFPGLGNDPENYPWRGMMWP